MNKLIPILVLSVVIIGFTPALAESTEDLLAKITTLEKQVNDKQMIINEQIKVILLIKDNYAPVYDVFSWENYPDTGGFPTDWLKGEASTIKASCIEAKVMGYYGNRYCDFVQ